MDKIMNEVCVFLADGFEEIEGLTVVDLLRRAGIETRTVSIMGQEEIKGAHGIIVKADSLFENTEFSEQKNLLLPGGMPGTNKKKQHIKVPNKKIPTDKQMKIFRSKLT